MYKKMLKCTSMTNLSLIPSVLMTQCAGDNCYDLDMLGHSTYNKCMGIYSILKFIDMDIKKK